MRSYHHAQIQIARLSAHRSGISFARNAHASAIGHARGNAHLNHFRTPHAPLAPASTAGGAQFAGATAAIAGHVEAHFSGGLLDGSRAMARRTTSTPPEKCASTCPAIAAMAPA